VPTIVVETIAALRGALGAADRVALVPTMGALHDGHLALATRAKQLADLVVVSIFVNPLQFGPNEDYARYPRDLEGDAARLTAVGVDYIFAPTTDEMYPSGHIETKISAGEIGTRFEGGSRTGHFDGMLTVVAKLLNTVRPNTVLFGQKDAQQVFLVRRMVRDLDFAVTVEVHDTVREPDGLALSSRNRFLDLPERRAARALSRALAAAESSADRGVDAVLAASQSVIAEDDLVQLDYLKVVDPKTFLAVENDFHGTATVIIAAWVGSIRLIDNTTIFLVGAEQ